MPMEWDHMTVRKILSHSHYRPWDVCDVSRRIGEFKFCPFGDTICLHIARQDIVGFLLKSIPEISLLREEP